MYFVKISEKANIGKSELEVRLRKLYTKHRNKTRINMQIFA